MSFAVQVYIKQSLLDKFFLLMSLLNCTVLFTENVSPGSGLFLNGILGTVWLKWPQPVKKKFQWFFDFEFVVS